MRNNFFLDVRVFCEKSQKYKSYKSLKYGYKYFDTKILDIYKNTKNDAESQMVLKNHTSSVRVNELQDLNMVLIWTPYLTFKENYNAETILYPQKRVR